MGKRWAFLALCLLTAAAVKTTEMDAQVTDGLAVIPATHYVALTFDDGPQEDTTARLLDGLRRRGASVTFFLVGERAASCPELVRRMKAEGHQVGSHTWSHVRLQGAAAETILTETERAQAQLEQILGEETYWLRPPYGLLDERERALLDMPLVKWSVDPRDWESRNTQMVVDAVLDSIQDNSIVLLHDIYPSSVEAALQIIDILTPQGYRFVTVEELLALNGVEPQPGVLYRTGKG